MRKRSELVYRNDIDNAIKNLNTNGVCSYVVDNAGETVELHFNADDVTYTLFRFSICVKEKQKSKKGKK